MNNLDGHIWFPKPQKNHQESVFSINLGVMAKVLTVKKTTIHSKQNNFRK